NLCGAILGTILAGFFLLPKLGLIKTILVAAIANLLIGSLAIVMDRGTAAGSDEPAPEGENEEVAAPRGIAFEDGKAVFWLACAFVSGFVTISTQVAWTRVLTMVIGSSTYAFSVVVALFLIGLSLGALEIGRKVRTRDLRSTLFKVELATAIA